ncbi:MAG TPA: dihydroneopterin aldolase [Chitinivibrionales bacterium]|jgi:FolB domain-containing protein|nr:dihydroneopterin aldolase [Chitinivibrionales bacterium]
MPAAKLSIVDLLLRTVIGDNEWERDVKQDVVINLSFEFDASKAVESDSIADTVNYKALKRKIIAEVEGSRYRLLEKLAAKVLEIVMEDQRVTSATVRVDKPQALRYAKSVAVEMSERRSK